MEFKNKDEYDNYKYTLQCKNPIKYYELLAEEYKNKAILLKKTLKKKYFKMGDIVYHPKYGKGLLTSIIIATENYNKVLKNETFDISYNVTFVHQTSVLCSKDLILYTIGCEVLYEKS